MCYSGKCPFENQMGDCTLPFGEEKCPENDEPEKSETVSEIGEEE